MCGELLLAEEFARVLRVARADLEARVIAPEWLDPPAPPSARATPTGRELVTLVRQAGGLK